MKFVIFILLLLAVTQVAFAGVVQHNGFVTTKKINKTMLVTTVQAGASVRAILLTSATPYNNHKKTPILLKTLNPLQGCRVLGESQWVGEKLYFSANKITCGHHTHSITGFIYDEGSGLMGFLPSASNTLNILFTRSFTIRR